MTDQPYYQIREDGHRQFAVTCPDNRGSEGDGYYLGVFRERVLAELFIRALNLAAAGAPIAAGLDLDGIEDA